MNLIGISPVKECSIAATVIRADGYRENLGRVSYWNRSMLKRFEYKIKRHFTKNSGGLFVAAPIMLLHQPGMTAHELAALGTISILPFLGATVMVDGGEAIVANRILAGGTEPLNIGWGTGAGTAAVTDTTLFTEKAVDLSATSGSRTAGTSSRVTTTDTNDTYQVTGTRAATGAGTVTNAGLFDNVTIASGSLFMKGDFTGIGLASGDSIAFTCKVAFTN